MRNILTKFILLLVFVFGAVSIGNASFVKTSNTLDVLIVHGKTGNGIFLPIPSKYLKDKELCAPILLSIYHEGQLIYQITSLNSSLELPSFTKQKGSAIIVLEIEEYTYKRKINLDSF